ncbi:MAG: hypothetical protein M1834_004357 [Cirrosporium novae-zelandiae]|nr:MAG: hypothetical protein M1834_004357 [Cirrosporium novae-zelandiae]
MAFPVLEALRARSKEVAQRHVNNGEADCFEDLALLGFNLKNSDIDCPPANLQSSDLDNDVHPLFYLKNFDGLDPDEYLTLLPALRLASKLLTAQRTFKFLNRMIFADRVRLRGSKKAYRIFKNPEITPENQEGIEDFIAIMAKCVTFYFSDLKSRSHDGSRVLGLTQLRFGRNPDVTLDIEYLKFIMTNLYSYNDTDTARVLRFQFDFAVTIVHEFIHVLEFTLGEGAKFYFDDREEEECGEEWTAAVFGGRISNINELCGELGLAVDGGDEFYLIPMSYISDIQRPGWWTMVEADLVSLEIPLVGPTAEIAVQVLTEEGWPMKSRLPPK